ncbi:hypothetical protein H4I96_11529 [Botrytis cinerea]
MHFATLVKPLYKMIPAVDIETLPSAEVLYHRRSSETWSDGYHDQKKGERESSQGLITKTHSLAPSKTRFFFKNILGLSILFLILLNTLQLILIVSTSSKSLKKCLASPDIPELSLERSQTRRIVRTSPFTSRNITDGNEAWHNILPGHGVVALPESYVKKNNIAESSATHLYSGDTEPKHIYFIESYHVLHCLVCLTHSSISSSSSQILTKDSVCFAAFTTPWTTDYPKSHIFLLWITLTIVSTGFGNSSCVIQIIH